MAFVHEWYRYGRGIFECDALEDMRLGNGN